MSKSLLIEEEKFSVEESDYERGNIYSVSLLIEQGKFIVSESDDNRGKVLKHLGFI